MNRRAILSQTYHQALCQTGDQLAKREITMIFADLEVLTGFDGRSRAEQNTETDKLWQELCDGFRQAALSELPYSKVQPWFGVPPSAV
jgi:hypothetical protein